MAYELETVRISQEIFYYLLEHHELREEEEAQLYKAYTEQEEVQNLVKSQGEIAGSNIERYGDVIYLIPKEDNDFLGFSKAQLKNVLCKSGATDKDYYLSQFVILTLLVEFYDGQGSSSKAREYIRVGELQNCISSRLKEGADRQAEAEAASEDEMMRGKNGITEIQTETAKGQSEKAKEQTGPMKEKIGTGKRQAGTAQEQTGSGKEQTGVVKGRKGMTNGQEETVKKPGMKGQEGIAFTDMMQAYEALRSDDKGSRARTTKEGFLHSILVFLEKQGLIEYVEQDEMVKTTKKLDNFMDWNLLNQNNYKRVMRILGVTEDE